MDVAGRMINFGQTLHGDSHVARYPKNKWIVTDPVSGITAVDKDAFKPRLIQGTAEEISVNHLEYFAEAGIGANVKALEFHLREVYPDFLKTRKIGCAEAIFGFV
jgi:hypothetical protein